MTAKELLDKYGAPLDLRLRGFALFVADHLPSARLANGARLCDAIDFAAWLHELANVADAPALRGHDACPDCGHSHQDDAECGEPLGGGRICRCERKVPA